MIHNRFRGVLYRVLFVSVLLFIQCFFEKCTDEPPTVSKPPEDTTTTSHDFVFDRYFLGDNWSTLADVVVINDTCAIAVGWMYKVDSAGMFTTYNLARWNGKRWSLDTVSSYLPDGQISIDPLAGILVFSENDIVLSTGASAMHWNGKKWKGLGILYGAGWAVGNPRRLWGKSSDDFYGVGSGGSIVHWDGRKWDKIYTAISTTVQDIWGGTDPKNGETTIYCLASEDYSNDSKRIMRIDNLHSIAVMDSTGLSVLQNGIWFDPGKKYYTVGAGVYWKNDIESAESWTRIKPGEATLYYSNAIRGAAWNDIFVVGAFNEVAHFNGKTWMRYPLFLNSNLWRVSYKGNLMVAVGDDGRRGIAVVGRRR